MENNVKTINSISSELIPLETATQMMNDYYISPIVITKTENDVTKIVRGYRFDTHDVLKTIFGMNHNEPSKPDGQNDFGIYYGLKNNNNNIKEITLIIIQFDNQGNALTHQMHEFSNPEFDAPFSLK